MVDAVMQGKEPEINDTKTYNNGVKVVPSNLLCRIRWARPTSRSCSSAPATSRLKTCSKPDICRRALQGDLRGPSFQDIFANKSGSNPP
jgi:hypothetical protein